MRNVMRRVHNERGFTLAELLVVLVILGVLSAIAVLSVTRFIGTSTLSAANTELENVRTAIASCMSETEQGKLDDDSPVSWDGSAGVITNSGDDGTVYDASSYLRGKHLKATYTVAPDGQITGVTDQKWSGVTWEDGRWKKEKKK